jgi:hypothetical protein
MVSSRTTESEIPRAKITNQDQKVITKRQEPKQKTKELKKLEKLKT